MEKEREVAEVIANLSVERRIESFASRIAAAIRTAAIPALDGFVSFLRVRSGFQFGETVEPLECGLYPARANRNGELVRVDLNLPIGIPGIENVRRLLHIELPPFIIGVGEVAVEDTAEGVIVLRREISDIKASHSDSPEITPEMIDAGEDEILGAVGGAELGGHFSARELATEVYRAMTNMVDGQLRCVLRSHRSEAPRLTSRKYRIKRENSPR